MNWYDILLWVGILLLGIACGVVGVLYFLSKAIMDTILRAIWR